MINKNLNSDSNIRWIISQNKWLKTMEKLNENAIIDSKRQINSCEKDDVWNESRTYQNFNSDIFRMDILGNVCIKNIKFNNNKINQVFAYEFEHIISHCHGGSTSIENIGLLNAGINRSKSSTECFKLNFNEINGLNSRFGISFKDLEFKLENNLHKTCKLYNLYFLKRNGVWMIEEYSYESENKCLWSRPSKPIQNKNDLYNYHENGIYGVDPNTVLINDVILTAVAVALPVVAYTAGRWIENRNQYQKKEEKSFEYNGSTVEIQKSSNNENCMYQEYNTNTEVLSDLKLEQSESEQSESEQEKTNSRKDDNSWINNLVYTFRDILIIVAVVSVGVASAITKDKRRV
jgi:hypothetical protein